MITYRYSLKAVRRAASKGLPWDCRRPLKLWEAHLELSNGEVKIESRVSRFFRLELERIGRSMYPKEYSTLKAVD